MTVKEKNQIIVSWGFLEKHNDVKKGSILFDEGAFYEVDYISLEAEIVILNVL